MESRVDAEPISLTIGDVIGIGDECLGVIDSEDGDAVHITSDVFCGWATRAELRDGILSEREAETPRR
jgi:hypothetical protein